MFKFEELRVYQASLDFVDEAYGTTKGWPRDEVFGLSSQLRRSSTSISLNIAEGTSRSKREFCHFLDLARGSCYECAAILQIANRRSYLPQEELNELYGACHSLARLINALKLSIDPITEN